jgi:hypothetical protein
LKTLEEFDFAQAQQISAARIRELTDRQRWPNSAGVASLGQIVELARAYFAGKSGAAKKYFWKNSLKAYKWVKRSSDQPSV